MIIPIFNTDAKKTKAQQHLSAMPFGILRITRPLVPASPFRLPSSELRFSTTAHRQSPTAYFHSPSHSLSFPAILLYLNDRKIKAASRHKLNPMMPVRRMPSSSNGILGKTSCSHRPVPLSASSPIRMVNNANPSVCPN